MRIYIVGIVASGKTTLSKLLSEHLNLPFYELDTIVHPVVQGYRVKRKPEEQQTFIRKLEGDWIIEGTYRKSCHLLLDLADCIVFLDPPLKVRKKRILIRFIKQQLKLETCHYQSNIKMLRMMYKWTKAFEQSRCEFEKMMTDYADKVIEIKGKHQEINVEEILIGLSKFSW